MKQKFLKAGAGIGLSIGLCALPQPTGEFKPAPIRAEAEPLFATVNPPEQSRNIRPAVESIVPYLGQVGLRLVKIEDNKSAGFEVLVTPDGQCGSEFTFAVDEPAKPEESIVHLSLYGKVTDLTDRAKVNGEDMWNGKIGHGDNKVLESTSINPGSPASIQQTIGYIKESTGIVCNPETFSEAFP